MTDQAAAKQRGRPFRPGQSGNPKGRPPGLGKVAVLRQSIEQHVPGIIAKLVKSAKEGDTGAARLLLERAIPPIKANDEPFEFDMPAGTLTEQGKAVLAAVAAGQVPASQGTSLLAALGTLAKITEIDELERRIAALEEKQPAR